MKIWEQFKEYLITRAINGNWFYTYRTLPATDKEKYWYNRGLEDSLLDLKRYEKQCEKTYGKKYNSLLKCMDSHKVSVYYDEGTNTTHISRTDKI